MHVVEGHTFVAVLGFRSVGSLIRPPVTPQIPGVKALVDVAGSEGKCDVDVRCLDEVCKNLSVSDS